LRDNGQVQAAREPLSKAQEVRERLVKSNPGVPRFLHDLAHTYISLAVLHAREGDRNKSLAQNEKARDLLERLVLLDPAPRYRQELGGAWFNIGAASGALNRRADERKAFQRAREIQEELVKAHPTKMDYRCDMGRTMSNLGLNFGLARQYTDALLVLQEGLKVMRPAFEKAPEIVGYRNAMNALLGNLGEVERGLNHPAESVAAFLERQELWPNNPEELYRSACEFMRAAAIVGSPRTELTDQEKAEQQRYHDLTLQSLQRAVKCGFKDAERLQKERVLDPLRSRQDFQKLAELMPRREV
jgi:tetratricopeptide (TPR) repeat protein